MNTFLSKSKPTRPRSAYTLFFLEKRSEILSECLKRGQMTQKEVIYVMGWGDKPNRRQIKPGYLGRNAIKTLIAEKWESLLPKEKQIYEVSARKDVERCRKELKKWATAKKLQKSQHCPSMTAFKHSIKDYCDSSISSEDKDTNTSPINELLTSSPTRVVRCSSYASPPSTSRQCSDSADVAANKQAPIPDNNFTQSQQQQSTTDHEDQVITVNNTIAVACRDTSKTVSKSDVAAHINQQPYTLSVNLRSNSQTEMSTKLVNFILIDDLASQLDEEDLDFLCSLKSLA